MTKLRMILPKEFANFCYTRTYKWTVQDIAQCKELLASYNPNARQRGGYKQTALYFFVPFEIAEWLIERGADVNATNTYGTPLFKHASVGNYDICRLLIENGADVNIKNYAGETALFGAADNGHCDIIKLFLEHGADPCQHSYDFADRLTPLLYMLRHIDYVPEKNKVETAKLLVKAQQERSGIPNEEWKQAQKFIAEIGHAFNLHKSGMEENCRIEREAAMAQFYTLFGIEPVIKHNGIPITVDGKSSC